MIGSLRGTLTERKPEGVIIDVGGVGYEVAMAPSVVENLSAGHGEVVISTHMQVWSEGMRLYGFPTSDERDLFRLLISAQGVGPKVGLAILSTLGSETVREAVRSEDVTTFTRVSGVGKKTAQRLILDLKGKLEASEANVVRGASRSSQLWEALAALGYRSNEIRSAVAAGDPRSSFEDQLRAALRELAQ
ncbi:MAG: Holliday junction branch migration protein RuvA [Actinomycetia bacterium]|nr:Holliday junction branch migration protein RuvA [Actinomycetes bacterium]